MRPRRRDPDAEGIEGERYGRGCPTNESGGVSDRRKLPQRGQGQSSGRKRVLV